MATAKFRTFTKRRKEGMIMVMGMQIHATWSRLP